MNKASIGLVAFSLISSTALADVATESNTDNKSGVYVGLDIFKGESSLEVTATGSFFGSAEEEFDQSGFRLKIGKRVGNNFIVQGYLKSEDFDEAFDNRVYGFGADAIIAFPVNPNFQPFVLGGFIFDFTELEKDPEIILAEDTLNAVGLKLGLGALFPISNSVEIAAGFDWQYRTWQDIVIVSGSDSVEIGQEDTSKTFYAGLNYFF